MKLPVRTLGACCAPLILSLFLSNACSAAIVATGDAEFDGAIRVASNSGDGSLLLTEPTALQGSEILIASVPDSRGSVIVDGAAYEIDSPTRPSIQVGGLGNGSLEILNGGRISSNNTADMRIGFESTGIGNVRVAGPNSSLHLPATTLTVGQAGQGVFSVEDGATAVHETVRLVSSGRRPTVMASAAAIRGQGSLWEIRGGLTVSDSNLTVAEGGHLRSGGGSGEAGNVSIGTGGAQPAFAIIEGTGSSWQHSGTAFIRYGSQIIRNGGVVNVRTLHIGTEGTTPTAFSQLIIDGAGSQMTTSWVELGGGNGSSKEIRITNGGRLNLAGSASINGRVLLDGLGAQWLGGEESRTALGERDDAELLIRNGASATHSYVQLGGFGNRASVEVSGAGSRWQTFSLDIAEDGRIELDEGRLLGRLGNPQVNPAISNRGLIHGSGSILQQLENKPRGRVEVGPGQELAIEGINNEPLATIDVIQGVLEIRSSFANQQRSRISLLDSTLRTPFASSQGEVAQNFGLITAIGDNHFYGAIDNLAQGQIRLSGNGQTVFHGDIRNDGIISASAGSVVDFRGEYTGNGILGGGSVAFAGEVSAGENVDVMTFGGDVELAASGVLNIEVRQGDSDRLTIVGDATLSGALELEVLSALSGDLSLEIIDARSVIGTFDDVPAPGTNLGHGVIFDELIYHPDSVVVSLLQQTPDFNLDGNVDRLDLDAWSAGSGMARGAQLSDGDADRDGDVDGADFIALQAAMHSAVAAANSQAVPEPSCCVLALIASAWLGGLGRRQH